MNGPTLRPTFTILGVMRDVAILAVAITGLAAPQNPIVCTLAFFALCYFAFRFWFLVGPPMVARLFRPSPVEEEGDEEEGIVWRDESWS